jgi:transcriptional regulator with PAS, ATPase and Fis domain
MRQIEDRVRRIAKQAEAVLIEGESGVGKEIVARRLHSLDPRVKDQAMVAINCAAVPESIAEAEFFGYERGAFTGANKTKRGYFEQAHGGTLFLDEIGDLSLALQAKLLRVLQDKSVVRLGSERSQHCAFKLICATNRNLKQLVSAGKFREDLYYRIAVFCVTVPPLRVRTDDVIWLAEQFLRDDAIGETVKVLSPAARSALVAYAWPGNVRELRNVLARARVLSDDGNIQPQHLEFENGRPSMTNEERTLSEYLASCEKSFIEGVLEQKNGHLGQTAESLGISRKNLWEKMRRLANAGVAANEAEILERNTETPRKQEPR